VPKERATKNVPGAVSLGLNRLPAEIMPNVPGQLSHGLIAARGFLAQAFQNEGLKIVVDLPGQAAG
jgi:hypothetical protein